MTGSGTATDSACHAQSPRARSLRRIAVIIRSPLVCSALGHRTPETFMLMLPELLERGIEVDVVAPVVPKGDGDQLLDPRLCVVPLPGYRSGWELYLIKAPVLCASIWRTVRRRRDDWDLIWLVDFDLYTPFIERVAVVSGVPAFLYLRARYDFLFHWRRTRGLRAPAAAAMRAWLRGAIPRTTRRMPTVVTGSALRSALAPDAPRSHVFTSTLVRERDVQHARLERRSGGSKTLLAVGRVHFAKGLRTLVQAVAVLRDEFPIEVRVVGPTVPEHVEELRDLAASLGVADALTFVGPVQFGDRLWEEYAAGDVFVHPSLTEGTPKALVEAMAAGLPVVASRVGGIPDMVTDGRDALLVSPGDPGELTAALRRVLSDGVLAEQLGRQAQARATSLTLERQVDSLLQFLSTTFDLDVPVGTGT